MEKERHVAERQELFMDKGYALFSSKGIEPVTMQEIAVESRCGTATLYRYYKTKSLLVIAIAARLWNVFIREVRELETAGMSAAQRYTVFVDSFVRLYREHSDRLRFNEFFTIYIRSEHVGWEAMEPYREVIWEMETHFHRIYENARRDHTLRLDIPEKVMLSTTLQLMLAAATRFALGPVCSPESGYDPEGELLFLRNVLLEKYTVKE